MSLWSATDANTGAPKFAVAGGLGVSGNGDTLYGNTTSGAFVTGAAIGVFGVSAEEKANTTGESIKVSHAGWVLRKQGTGGRAGRVHYETIVAQGSQNDGTSDDAVLPQ